VIILCFADCELAGIETLFLSENKAEGDDHEDPLIALLTENRNLEVNEDGEFEQLANDVLRHYEEHDEAMGMEPISPVPSEDDS